MNEITVHPNVYATGRNRGLVPLLERVWLREQEPGEGTLYVLSGFANYNGGVRFFPIFRRHVESGGRVVALFAGSTGQNLTSRQVVQGMLECGAEVSIVNRKRLMHVKSYGSRTRAGDMVVVSSGNFTGPGMAQNVEMSILLDRPTARGIGFSWADLVSSLLSQSWQLHRPKLNDTSSPAWRLLYDEQASGIVLDETNEVTLIVILGHADTVRINAVPGTVEARGTQYFWLSRDCYDFFPGAYHSQHTRNKENLLLHRRIELRGSGSEGGGSGDLRGGEQPGFPSRNRSGFGARGWRGPETWRRFPVSARAVTNCDCTAGIPRSEGGLPHMP